MKPPLGQCIIIIIIIIIIIVIIVIIIIIIILSEEKTFKACVSFEEEKQVVSVMIN